jgi:hypothetical protein
MTLTTTRRHVLAALIPCWLATTLLGLASDGVYHDDDLTHFLIARWARWFPSYLLHIWGRPGLTAPLATVAWFGDPEVAWHAGRILSAAVTAIGAYLAASTAARLGVARPWLVVIACYSQPLNALLAATTLTENFAALYLSAAVALLIASRPLAASAVFSLLLVTRHETLALIPLWAVAVAMVARGPQLWLAMLAVPWAPIAHNVLFRIAFGRWPVEIFFAPSGSTEYPPAGVLSYLPDAFHAIGPALPGLAIVGGRALWRRDGHRAPARRGEFDNRSVTPEGAAQKNAMAAGRFVIPAMAGAYLLIHVLIRSLGVFASGGYGRFMVAIAPLVAILAVAGIDAMTDQLRRGGSSRRAWGIVTATWLVGWLALEQQIRIGRVGIPSHWIWVIRALIFIALICLIGSSIPQRGARWQRPSAAMLVVCTLFACALTVRPLRLGESQRVVADAIDWYELHAGADAPVFATDPWISYRLGLVEHPRAHKGPRLLATMPVGTIVIWDAKYSDNDFHRIRRNDLDDHSAYEFLRAVGGKEGGGEIRLYRKTDETPVPQDAAPSYPPDLAASLWPIEGVYYIRPTINEVSQRSISHD